MAPTIGVNLRVTGHCNQGGRKYMEDAFVVAYQQTKDEKDLEYAYFGIFDGHGGKEAALFAKEHLMSYIVNQKNFWSDDDDTVLKAIRDGFITTHLAMWKEVGNWPKTMSGLPSTSGTTSSVAFIRRGKLYVGHVGDSKIVLGYQAAGSESWLPNSLTKDHKPESPREKNRIYSVGGLVMTKAGVERVVWNRPRMGHKGPIRRSTHFDQIPFLAVARSLGDLWSYNYLRREFVVSPEPDVGVFTLDPRRDRCIILGSDGLWNMLATWDAVRLVQRAEEENKQMILEGGGATGVGKPSNNPSKILVDKALYRWFDMGMRADNTSVVTVLLDPPGPPKTEVLLRQKIMQKLRPRDEQGSELDSSTQNHNESNVNDGKGMKRPSDVSSPEASEDPLPKEKKRISSSSDLRTSNLPKPVVLSPRRIVKQPPPPDKPKTPPDDRNCSDATKVDGEKIGTTRIQPEDDTDSASDSIVDVCKNASYDSEKPEESSSSSPDVTTDSSEEKTDKCSSVVKENKCDPGKSSNVDMHRENGRTRLSEVDNLVKTKNTEGRLSDRSKNVSAAQENKGDTQNVLKKLSERSMPVHKRRRDDDVDSSIPSKSVKFGASSWRSNATASCQVTAARELVHNTRSQQRSRKVKI